LLKKIFSGFPHLLKLVNCVRNGSQVGFSFNLSDRCPLKCAHCYWLLEKRIKELSDDQVVDFFRAQKEQGMLLATIVGGEPYVRGDLLEKVAGILPATWVVTSGAIPLRHLPGTTHFISIDGDPETHDRIRGLPGLHGRIIKHLARARESTNFPAAIHTVLNHQNYQQIDSLMERWRSSGLVDGIVFSTMTPIRGSIIDLSLNRTQYKEIRDRLRMAKERFGKFLLMSDPMISQINPELMASQSPSTCPTAMRVASFDALGRRIPQCILGENADCSRCGCVITSMFEPFLKFDLSTWRVLAGLYTP
jgi:MoaA/NifB/PqqE/SkfB family radical SAM enzyme